MQSRSPAALASPPGPVHLRLGGGAALDQEDADGDGHGPYPTVSA